MLSRVLVVDDDQDLCEELCEILSEEGFDVVFCCHPKKVYGLLEKKNYDFILLDIKMPEISGEEVLAFIREHDLKSHVFVLTGSPLANAEKAMKIHELADKVIAKPFKIPLLLELMHKKRHAVPR